MNEMTKLATLLVELGIPFKVTELPYDSDGRQIIVYNKQGERMDDAIWAYGSHGYEKGLLETFKLNDCAGYETAFEIAHGWYNMYHGQPVA